MASSGERIKCWAAQIRAPFLILSVVLVAVGGAAAWHDDAFRLVPFVLAAVGVVLAHAAVNVFNELSDHRTGIDAKTTKTPFSGGSGTLQAGHLRYASVRAVAIATLVLALAIGVYLTWISGWPLMILIVLGGLAAVFYTTHLARWMLGELAAGMTLGSFVVIGTYYCQTSDVTTGIVFVSVPVGLLTSLLLYLNEFPDLEADRAGGRKHLVIVLGRKAASRLYAGLLALVYGLIAIGAITSLLPKTVLLALLTLPLAVRAAMIAWRHQNEIHRMVPAMAANVGVVLVTDALLAVAYLLA